MKKRVMTGLVVGLVAVGALSFAAAQQQPQSDTMQSDGMKKDTMGQDSMSKDKMSHGMSKAKVLKGWVSDSECAAHGDKKCESLTQPDRKSTRLNSSHANISYAVFCLKKKKKKNAKK